MPHSLELEVREESILAGRQDNYGFSSNHFLSPACVHTPCLLPTGGQTRGQVLPLGEDQAASGSREIDRLTQEGPCSPRDPTWASEMASRQATGTHFRVR